MRRSVGGAWLNEQPIQVSDIDSIEAQRDLHRQSQDARERRALGRASASWSRARIASAATAISCTITCWRRARSMSVIESDVNILDIAALAVIVEAAGGRFTDLEGKPVSLGIESVLASNGQLARALLASARSRWRGS